MWDRRAAVLNVHDGDTLTALLDQGFDETVKIAVRLLGVYAPELNQPGGPECQAFVADWVATHSALAVAWPVVVTTARMKVADHEQMTFTRYVGTVTSLDGSDNLNLDVQAFIDAQGYGPGI
jgi:endonuclease YncB( thermonuclease family)